MDNLVESGGASYQCWGIVKPVSFGVSKLVLYGVSHLESPSLHIDGGRDALYSLLIIVALTCIPHLDQTKLNPAIIIIAIIISRLVCTAWWGERRREGEERVWMPEYHVTVNTSVNGKSIGIVQ